MLERKVAITNLLADLADRFPARINERMLVTWAEALSEYRNLTIEDVARACKKCFQNDEFFPKSFNSFRSKVFDLKRRSQQQTETISAPKPCRFNTCDDSGFLEMTFPGNLMCSPTLAACSCSNTRSLPLFSSLEEIGMIIHPEYMDRIKNRFCDYFSTKRDYSLGAVFKKIPEVKF